MEINTITEREREITSASLERPSFVTRYFLTMKTVTFSSLYFKPGKTKRRKETKPKKEK